MFEKVKLSNGLRLKDGNENERIDQNNERKEKFSLTFLQFFFKISNLGPY